MSELEDKARAAVQKAIPAHGGFHEAIMEALAPIFAEVEGEIARLKGRETGNADSDLKPAGDVVTSTPSKENNDD